MEMHTQRLGVCNIHFLSAFLGVWLLLLAYNHSLDEPSTQQGL